MFWIPWYQCRKKTQSIIPRSWIVIAVIGAVIIFRLKITPAAITEPLTAYIKVKPLGGPTIKAATGPTESLFVSMFSAVVTIQYLDASITPHLPETILEKGLKRRLVMFINDISTRRCVDILTIFMVTRHFVNTIHLLNHFNL